MKRKIFLSIILAAFMIICQSGWVHAQVANKTYLPTSALIANPDRGWYEDYYSFANHLTGSYRPLDSIVIRASREENQITLILRLFYLHQFLNETSVSSDYLTKMQADFDAVRTAGVKCIVRFAYSDSQNATTYDATPEKVLSHIQSLSTVLTQNSDVILAVQAGFIGAWGEWYYTENFAGSGYVPNATDLNNRRAVVESLLNILPNNIQVQVRTPAIKQSIVESVEPLQDAEGYDDSYKARVAHHNDCFLANSSDYGTYNNLTADLAYMAQDTKFTIAGGETCDASNTYSDCENAIPRMELLHWTYLNTNYNKEVYQKWDRQGCLQEADMRLGYRIYLTDATLPDSAQAGDEVLLTFHLKNIGFAAPTQYKPIQVILKNSSTQQLITLPYTGTNDDIRYWWPGAITTSGKITLPDTIADGNYALYLRFPDQDEKLAQRPTYCIQLANIGLWNSLQGYNQLNHILAVGTGDGQFLPAPPSLLSAAVISETQIDLSWADTNATKTGIEIYRCINSEEAWQLVAVLPANSTSYSDESLSSGTTYAYLVRIANEFGFSEWSDKVIATTLGVGLHEPLTGHFEIYPNPMENGTLTINNPFTGETMINIYNSQGMQILQTLSDQSQISMSNLNLKPGLYLISVQSKDQTLSNKFLVK